MTTEQAGTEQKKAQYEGSALQALMETSVHTICERCYCCDAVVEEIDCWQCGGFPDEDEDGYECTVCHDEGVLSRHVCLGRCDADGNHVSEQAGGSEQ